MQTGTIIALVGGGAVVVGIGGYFALQSIRNTANNAARNIGLPEAAVALAPALAGVGKGIQGLGEGIGGGVSKIGGGVGNAFTGVGHFVGAVGTGAGGVIGAVGNASNAVTSGVSNVGSGVKTVAKDAYKLANPVNQVKAVGGAIKKLKFW